jgi:hypothetical protein
MKQLNSKIGAIASALLIMFFFGSCSRQLTSISKSDKLMTSQTIDNNKENLQKPKSLNVESKIIEKSDMVCSNNEPINKGNCEQKGLKKNTAKAFVQNINHQAHKIIKKQNEALANLSSNHNIASHQSSKQTESWLGLAITCLIVAIILSIFGFGFAAAVLWEIGIIILVIALVFFILWLMAEAVSS